MSKFYFTIFLLLFLPLLSFSQAQNYRFEQFNEQQGLSHNCIHCIIQDSKGFIWIGTEGGLDKYDGYKITEYIYDRLG